LSVSPEDRVRLRIYDMLEAIEHARTAVGELTLQQLLEKPVNRLAAERAIEIISEASRHIPGDMKSAAPHIAWREIAGIGNVLRHNYPLVNTRTIWAIVHDELGALEAALREMLTHLPEED
jgi:uncharacterized protein with HEPN domain